MCCEPCTIWESMLCCCAAHASSHFASSLACHKSHLNMRQLSIGRFCQEQQCHTCIHQRPRAKAKSQVIPFLLTTSPHTCSHAPDGISHAKCEVQYLRTGAVAFAAHKCPEVIGQTFTGLRSSRDSTAQNYSMLIPKSLKPCKSSCYDD